MPSGSSTRGSFAALRERLLQRLLDLRPSFDVGLARCDEPSARAQLAAMLERLEVFLVTADVPSHRVYVRTHLAQRGGDAGGLAAAVSTLVAVGDICARVALEAASADPAYRQLALRVAERTMLTARACTDLLVEQAQRRADALAGGSTS